MTNQNGKKYLEYDRKRLVGPPVCGEDGAEDVRSSGPDELGRVVGVDHGEEGLHPGPVSGVGGDHAGAGLQSPGLDPPLGIGLLLLLVLSLGVNHRRGLTNTDPHQSFSTFL